MNTSETPGICDRCGFRFPLRTLRKEWSGLMVCPDDWDPKPRTLNPPRIYPEGMPIANSRAEPEPIILGDNDVQPEDL